MKFQKQLVEAKRKITETEEMFDNVENFNKQIHSEQKSFFYELKQELADTEKDVRTFKLFYKLLQ